MILLIASRSDWDLRERVFRIAALESDTRLFDSVEDVTADCDDAWCAVVLDRVVTPRTLELVDGLRTRAPRIPRVLVTEHIARHRPNASLTDVDGVIHLFEAAALLGKAVRRIRLGDIRARLRLAASLQVHLPLLFRRIIIAASSGDSLPRTVATLAASLNRGRSTLWKTWSDVHQPTGVRLEDLLDWLLLLDAASQKVDRVTWTDVAASLNIHEHTLARIAFRVTGATLRAVGDDPGIVFAPSLVEKQIARFLGASRDPVA
jgi:hypothetical protein